MTDMATMLFIALGLMLLSIVSVVLVAVWVYRDARSRGLEAWVWTLVTVLVPSFIGLLLYFLVGRKETRRPCPGCGRQMPERNEYCGGCGARMPQEPPKTRPATGKGLLISGLVCVGLTVLLGVSAVGALILTDENFKPEFFSVSTVYLENHGSDYWNVQFHYTNKTPSHSFRLGEDGPYVLNYEGKCQEGPLTLRVTQGELERTVDLSGGDLVKGSLDLSAFRPGERVKLELDHNGDEGRKVEFSCSWEKDTVPGTTLPAPAGSGQ